MPNGNISIDWEVGTVAFSVTLCPSQAIGFSGRWHAVDTANEDSSGLFDAGRLTEDVAQLREAIAACDAFEAMLDVMLEAGSTTDPDFERQDQNENGA